MKLGRAIELTPSVEDSIGERPEMTSLLKLLKLDQKIEGMGLDLSGVTGSQFN